MTQPTQVIGGTQIPLDAAYVANLVAQNILGARGQDIQIRGQDLSRYGMDQGFALSGRDQDIQQRGQDQTFWSNILALGEQRRQADMAYSSDAARFGLDVAGFNYQQRLGKIQADLAKNDQFLSQESLNYAQRQGLVDSKLGVIDRLTSRRGPQDYVAYNSLLNQLDPPTPERSATIEPFAMLEGLVREVDLPDVDTSKLDQPYKGGMAGVGAFGSAPINAPQIKQVAPLKQPTATLSNVRGFGDGGGFAPQQPESMAKPASGHDFIDTVAPRTWDELPSAGQGSIDPKTGLYVPPMEHGGEAKGNMIEVLTGDSSKGKPNPEVVKVVSRDPATRMVVTPVDKLTGKKPKKKAESGGVYGTGNTDPTFQVNQYSPNDLGNAPFLRKALGQDEAPAFQGFGSTVSNPSIGISGFPSTLNLQRFRDIAPTERTALQSVAEQGLELDFGDLLERSRRAAPFGREFGVSRFTRV